jgi:hypothetical protein
MLYCWPGSYVNMLALGYVKMLACWICYIVGVVAMFTSWPVGYIEFLVWGICYIVGLVAMLLLVW